MATQIHGTQDVRAGTLDETILKSTNSPTDNYILTYDLTTTGFTWIDPADVTSTDEEVQDVIGAILVDSNSIDLVYSDATPSIVANLIIDTTSESTTEASALVTGANGVSIKVDDATIEGSGAGAAGAESLRVKADGIRAAHIDWGTDAGYVNASLVPFVSGHSYSGVATNVMDALEELQGAASALEWMDSALDYVTDNTALPPSETLGDRYILSDDGGAPHANYDGASAGDVVEFNGATWDAFTPTTGTFVSSDAAPTGVYYWGGAAWSFKAWEQTTASSGVLLTNYNLTLDLVTLTAGAAETIDPTADKFALLDASDDLTYKVTLNDLVTAIAGSGLTNTASQLTIDSGAITSGMIANGTIVNADISATADIALSKLVAGTDGYIIVGAQTTGVPTYVAMTGDVTISNTGLTAIAADAVHDSMIDWGTGAGQVDASDMPVIDTATYFTATTVETVLAEMYLNYVVGGHTEWTATAAQTEFVWSGSTNINSADTSLKVFKNGLRMRQTEFGGDEAVNITATGTTVTAAGGGCFVAGDVGSWILSNAELREIATYTSATEVTVTEAWELTTNTCKISDGPGDYYFVGGGAGDRFILFTGAPVDSWVVADYRLEA